MAAAGETISVEWDPQVAAFLQAALGAEAFARMQAVLAVPPLSTCLRVNTLVASPQEVLAQLQQLLPGVAIAPHPRVPVALIMRGSGPHSLCPADIGAAKEVVISRKAGEAVLRGAQVFVPGVLACSAGLAAGDTVAVTVAQDLPGSSRSGITRGTILAPGGSGNTAEDDDAQQQPGAAGSCSSRAAALAEPRLCVGIGTCQLSRTELFRQQHGVAVVLQQRVFDVPSLNGQLQGQVMLQNLPSIVAAQVLSPAPGSRILDMCAAPGGKSTMLAQLMGGRGEVVAFDRSHAKVDDIRALAEELGCSSCISAFKMDATKAVLKGDEATAAAEAAAAACDAQAGGEQGQQLEQAAVEEQQQQQHGTLPEDQQLARLSLKAQKRLQRRVAAMRARGQSPPAAEFRYAGLTPAKTPGFPPESFDAVLLDAPCTALGLRPRLVQQQSLADLLETAQYQRQLLAAAVQLLRPGGCLVYSTCSINPAENEINVRYALDSYPCLQLVPAEPALGGPGLTGPADLAGMRAAMAAAAAAGKNGPGKQQQQQQAAAGSFVVPEQWLTQEEAAMVQRFDPAGPDDTIGFFVSRFRKVRNCAEG